MFELRFGLLGVKRDNYSVATTETPKSMEIIANLDIIHLNSNVLISAEDLKT